MRGRTVHASTHYGKASELPCARAVLRHLQYNVAAWEPADQKGCRVYRGRKDKSVLDIT